MGEINISRDEQEALSGVDIENLEKLISRAIDARQATCLHELRLSRCGPYVAGRLSDFEWALRNYSVAKSGQKRADTEERARRAGMNLSQAVSGMKHRMDEEKKEAELFQVDDQIFEPYSFSREMDVSVGYRWRRTAAEEWNFGRITFHHDFVERPNLHYPPPKRKPSAAKQREMLQSELRSTWQHLMKLSLYAVRDFFRNGGDGAEIPKTFKVRPDRHSGYLNNYSANFWSVSKLDGT